jgi:hypothetical protein
MKGKEEKTRKLNTIPTDDDPFNILGSRLTLMLLLDLGTSYPCSNRNHSEDAKISAVPQARNSRFPSHPHPSTSSTQYLKLLGASIKRFHP